ncbi:MAG: four helix bundle protein [Candidatus Vogelbacteria bacterium]|nr:four helix bundle protein [Candidatus Vogelbacteria bacterium]
MKQEVINEPKRLYDLEERTLIFAKRVRVFIKRLPRTITNIEDGKQLARSSGSVGANYREANDCLSKKDFALRARVGRKEAKESIYWLELVDTGNDSSLQEERVVLAKEATELMKILGAIIVKTNLGAGFHS